MVSWVHLIGLESLFLLDPWCSFEAPELHRPGNMCLSIRPGTISTCLLIQLVPLVEGQQNAQNVVSRAGFRKGNNHGAGRRVWKSDVHHKCKVTISLLEVMFEVMLLKSGDPSSLMWQE